MVDWTSRMWLTADFEENHTSSNLCHNFIILVIWIHPIQILLCPRWTCSMDEFMLLFFCSTRLNKHLFSREKKCFTRGWQVLLHAYIQLHCNCSTSDMQSVHLCFFSVSKWVRTDGQLLFLSRQRVDPQTHYSRWLTKQRLRYWNGGHLLWLLNCIWSVSAIPYFIYSVRRA